MCLGINQEKILSTSIEGKEAQQQNLKKQQQLLS